MVFIMHLQFFTMLTQKAIRKMVKELAELQLEHLLEE